jgi:hypothetical protein
MSIQIEFEFNLPKGYTDAQGTLHKKGTMRLATAADEILPLKDPRVQQNQAYITVIVLSRVITKLGTLPAVNTRTVENFFASDLAYLQAFYNRINGEGSKRIEAVCPNCKKTFEVETSDPGK